MQRFDREGWQWDPCRWWAPRLQWQWLLYLEQGPDMDQGAHLWVRGRTEILNIKYDEVSPFGSAPSMMLGTSSWVDSESLSVAFFHQGIIQVMSLSMQIFRHPGHGRSTKSMATGTKSKPSCFWLWCFFRSVCVFIPCCCANRTCLSLSAPGGPPERSALSASSLQGAVPRTPCSPIPGVGRLQSLWMHLGKNPSMCAWKNLSLGFVRLKYLILWIYMKCK